MSNPNPTRTREFANTHTCVAIETLVSGHVAREWYSTYQCTRGSRSRVPLPADPGIGPDCRWRCFRSTPRGRFQGKGGGHSDSVCVCVCVCAHMSLNMSVWRGCTGDSSRVVHFNTNSILVCFHVQMLYKLQLLQVK